MTPSRTPAKAAAKSRSKAPRPPPAKPPAKAPAKAPAKRKLSLTELGRQLGLSRQACHEWARRPGCPREQTSRGWVYLWPDFAEWRTQELVKQAVGSRPKKSDTLADAEERKAIAEARTAEVKLDAMRGELVDVAAMRREMERLCLAVRGPVLAMRSRYAADVVAASTMREATQLLTRMGDEVLEALRTAATAPPADPPATAGSAAA